MRGNDITTTEYAAPERIKEYNQDTAEAQKEPDMIASVKAKFSNGVLTPLEPLDLDEGEEVLVSIEDTRSPERGVRALRTAAGAWKGTHDPDELLRNIYSDRLVNSRPEPKI